MSSPRRQLFGVSIDPLRMSEAVDRLVTWLDDEPPRCRYVVTPNVDHTVLLERSADLRAAYAEADLVLADGWPVVLASRLLGQPLPERVTGADVVQVLYDRVQQTGRPTTTFLLGAGPGVAERAAANVEARWPNVKVVGAYCPPLGFERDEAENQNIVQMLRATMPEILVVGLGAPKQELWVHRFHRELPVKASFCVGATIDFLAGEKSRAPRWMQRVGLEWFYRMITDPKRLVKRYAYDAWVFPRLVIKEFWRKK